MTDQTNEQQFDVPAALAAIPDIVTRLAALETKTTGIVDNVSTSIGNFNARLQAAERSMSDYGKDISDLAAKVQDAESAAHALDPDIAAGLDAATVAHMRHVLDKYFPLDKG